VYKYNDCLSPSESQRENRAMKQTNLSGEHEKLDKELAGKTVVWSGVKAFQGGKER
jgi:hypothetical protein